MHDYTGTHPKQQAEMYGHLHLRRGFSQVHRPIRRSSSCSSHGCLHRTAIALGIRGFLEAVYSHVIWLPTIQAEILPAAMLLFVLSETWTGHSLARVGWRSPEASSNGIDLHRHGPRTCSSSTFVIHRSCFIV